MTGIPEEIAEALLTHVGVVRKARSLGEGCIANATRIEADRGHFFLKWGPPSVGRTFLAESHGLEVMRRATCLIRIPEVIAVESGEAGRSPFLLMEWIEQGSPDAAAWRRLAEGLAEMHRVEGESFGFHANNFIGRLPQSNQTSDLWPPFFREHRLLPQVRMAKDGGRWRQGWTEAMAYLLDHLDELLSFEPFRSTLHGDLWRGNCLFDTTGRPVLIDPAAYYGDRETDLAMMELFGGFPSEVYEVYDEAWPLDEGWRSRRDVYQLYHVLNHLNHFGESYASQVENILSQFRP